MAIFLSNASDLALFLVVLAPKEDLNVLCVML